MKNSQNSGTTSIGLHQGHAIYNLAKNYNDLPAVMLEVVQNAIDSMASRIKVTVDLQRRKFSVFDNGLGANHDKVVVALNSICDTLKRADKGKYGRFGLGLISPISVAESFTFTTHPRGSSDDYIEHTFVTSTIREQRNVSIPHRVVLPKNDDSNGVWYTTLVAATGLTKDRTLGSIKIADLSNNIATRYRVAIIERKIDITIEIVGDDGSIQFQKVEVASYSGEKVETYADSHQDCGKVVFDLYIARMQRGSRKGEITFGDSANPSRIKAKELLACAGNLLGPSIGKALTSGVLEGEVVIGKIRMHPDRTRFEMGDDLVALCVVIEKWFSKVGDELIGRIEEETSNNRLQTIGIRAMHFFELLASQTQFKSVISNITIGTVGPGHTIVPKKNVIGTDNKKSLSVSGTGGKGDTTPTGSPGKKGEHKNHKPATVYGDKGRHRTDVKGNSTGLRLAHTEMEDYSIPFTFDSDSGLLTVNTLNPNWGLCTESDEYLVKYHHLVFTCALCLESQKSEDGQISPQIERFAWQQLGAQVFLIKNAEAVTPKS
jgi:hypothetical protein